MFGFYAKLEGLFNPENLMTGGAITLLILLIRFLFFRTVIRTKLFPLTLFAPRGLITILLFLSIPSASRLPLINEEVITIVILFTIFIMMIGNMIPERKAIPEGESQLTG
jgi:hypothetical protein